MARRTIGQESVFFTAGHRASDLNALARLIDWTCVDNLMAPISAAAKDEQG